jgi:hypothetical protein
MNSEMSGTEFWKKQIAPFSWSQTFENNVLTVRKYLVEQKRRAWLTEVLRYLPEGHRFETTVYLIMGYDNIVYEEDVAINLGSRHFNVDQRESLYYLIHELAHAGYFNYQAMPELRKMRTIGDLLKVTRVLTHLEGMGVISALRKRMNDRGFLDKDYQVLRDISERSKRVTEYFKIISSLERNLDVKLQAQHMRVFEKMSGRKTRLWYITECYMAQQIENKCGIQTLRQLVIEGADEFFNVYSEIKNRS